MILLAIAIGVLAAVLALTFVLVLALCVTVKGIEDEHKASPLPELERVFTQGWKAGRGDRKVER